MLDGDIAQRKTPSRKRRGIYTTIDSDVEYRVGILGPQGLDHDLSLKNFYSETSAADQPELAKSLADFAEGLGAKRVFAPTVRFTRNVVRPEQLLTKIVLPNGIPVYRNRAIEADATPLPEPGDAMIYSGAGCSAIAMVRGSNIVGGHAGRDGLVDRNYVLDPGTTNQGSIVDSMAQIVSGGRRANLRRASCRAFFSVPMRSFYYDNWHKEHGVFNRALAGFLRGRYGAFKKQIVVPSEDGRGYYLDQGELIAAQAQMCGFHTVATCLKPLDPGGQYAHTRHAIEGMREKRNLVGIVRVR